jgi:hypothetical protein
MIDVKRKQESKVETDSIGFAFNGALIKEAELWMGAQRDFLSNIESMMNDWLRRQREAFDVSSRSVRKICDSRNIVDVAQAQNEWVSDCLEWTASQLRAAGKDAAALTWKTAERLSEAARERSSALRQQSEALSHPPAPVPMEERAAAE